MNHLGVGQTVPIWECAGDEQSTANYGRSVSDAGDVNGDGYDDWLVGAHSYSTTNSNAGKAYLYLGSASGLSTTPAWTSSGNDQVDAYYGRSVSGVGDVNNDGYDDWLVGADGYDTSNANAGRAYLYLGSSSISGTTPFWTSSGQDQANANYGQSISGAGDINGDGYSDWLVSAPFYDNSPGWDQGRVYLYLGSSSISGTTFSWTDSGDNQSGSNYGYSVSGAGDVNGDGFDDWLVGAYNYDTSNVDAGKAYLYLGRDSSISLISEKWRSSGDDVFNGYFGSSVSSAGDVNGDGYDDWLVGAYYYTITTPYVRSTAGKAYLYLGSENIRYTENAWNSSGDDQTSAWYGRSVSNAGDINGDGFDDWLIGADIYDTTYINAGKVYLYLGSSDISGTIPSWTSSGDNDQASTTYGYSVASAGDVNGDGLSEWLVGAYNYNAPSYATGNVYLYRARGVCEYGEYISPVLDAEETIPTIWQSLEWAPMIQEDGTSLKLQIATNDDGATWDFVGPDGTADTFYTLPLSQEIFPGHKGRYLRYKAIFSSSRKTTEPTTKTPVLEDITFHFGERISTVEIISPNGGEDWMRKKWYPITWQAEGILGDTPVTLYYSTDNGEIWYLIATNETNDGVYNWTVPSVNTGSALIRIDIIDVYGYNTTDTSDASFAIDPPPPGAGDAPSGGGSSQFPVDDDSDSGSSANDISKSKSDDWPWLMPIAIILSVIVIISVCLNLYLIKTKQSSKVIRSEKNGKRIVRIDEILRKKRI
jgi:hypothetical protein